MTYTTFLPGRHRLTKATRREAEERARAAERAADGFRPLVAASFVEATRRLALGVDNVFIGRVFAGDPDDAMAGLAIAEFRQALSDELTEITTDAVVRAGERTASAWPEFDLGFQGRTENVLRQARQRSGTLVTEITNQTRGGIRVAVQEAIERGDNPRLAARSIRPLVGNLERHSIAVEKFRDRLIRQGKLARSEIDNLAARKASKLLTHRTQMIARTEMLWASNAAQYEYQLQLRAAGLIPDTATRVWIVTNDDRLCEECAPMDGQPVALEGQFRSDQLGRPGEQLRPRTVTVFADFPPLHPMCRCTTGLVA